MEEAFRNAIQGQVHFDAITRKVYSVDASIYEVTPRVVIIPKHVGDVQAAVRLARQYQLPVTARGAATGITGGCLGEGVVLDLTKLDQILEINVDARYAICEPGVVQNRLNEALEPLGFRLGPDTSTGDRATLGGMCANNAAGARSLKFGQMADHVEGVEVVLASGESLWLEGLDDQQWEEKRALDNVEGQLYREAYRIQQTYREGIKQHFPKMPRRVSGYNLDQFLQPGINLSKLITGSEGTLGVVTKIKVKIVPLPKIAGLCVLSFDTMLAAMQVIPELLQWPLLSLEMIDDKILKSARSSPSVHGKLDWLKGDPKVILVAEFEEDEMLEQFHQKMGGCSLRDKESQREVWEVRQAGLGLLLSKRSYSRAVAFIEDLAVPPEKLPSFMEQFLAYLNRQGKEAGIYGHVGAGCLHMRPYLDLRNARDISKMKEMMETITQMVQAHGGTLSGEHGDGLIRSWLNKELFGEKIYQAFVELKEAFDPHYLMNPGKIVRGDAVNENIRKSPQVVNTFLNFDAEGGFALSVDLCNGNGKCRKMEGTMCPSFQATGNEFDNTRARAHALRAAIRGEFPLDGQEVYDVLDLCLECKGCKTECPSQVDMAKMKSEFLYQYQEKHGYSLRTRLMGNIAKWNRMTSPFARLVNGVQQSKLGRQLQNLVGITPYRSLPKLATQTFSSWLHTHQQPKLDKQVVLFNDTFTQFNHPEVGISAVAVLNQLGYQVIIPSWKCCGRPLISMGMLKQAKKGAIELINHLHPFATKGLPIIGLEPSCILTLIDDYDGLLGKANTIKESCITFDSFLANHITGGKLPFDLPSTHFLLHGHCHQKALEAHSPTLAVLNALPGSTVTEIPSGCCGMAGSFGYEKEHYDISMQIGELILFPTLRNAPKKAKLIANGFSCRCHITHATSHTPLHLASALLP